MTSDNRRSERIRLQLPIELLVDGKAFPDLELVDISATGMQLRSHTLDVLNEQKGSEIAFDIRLTGRVAWVRPIPEEEGYRIGLEFARDDDEQRIG